MNSIIARLFVFINEILSVILFIIPIVTFIAAIMNDNLLYAGISLLALVLMIIIFGFAALIIENHKILKEINTKIKN